MNIKKSMVIGMAVFCLFSLSACSHSNPLAQKDSKSAVTFLLKASSYAEKNLNLQLNGKGYQLCMNGQTKKETCDALYKSMVHYAMNQNGFQSLSISDLTNQKIWEALKYEYARQQFDQI